MTVNPVTLSSLTQFYHNQFLGCLPLSRNELGAKKITEYSAIRNPRSPLGLLGLTKDRQGQDRALYSPVFGSPLFGNAVHVLERDDSKRMGGPETPIQFFSGSIEGRNSFFFWQEMAQTFFAEEFDIDSVGELERQTYPIPMKLQLWVTLTGLSGVHLEHNVVFPHDPQSQDVRSLPIGKKLSPEVLDYAQTNDYLWDSLIYFTGEANIVASDIDMLKKRKQKLIQAMGLALYAVFLQEKLGKTEDEKITMHECIERASRLTASEGFFDLAQYYQSLLVPNDFLRG